MYTVIVKRKIERGLEKLPRNVQLLFRDLREELEAEGPIQAEWKNFSALADDDAYHCHLGYRHAACCRCEKGAIEIEVYYIGSREGAPY